MEKIYLIGKDNLLVVGYQNKDYLYIWCRIHTADILLYCLAAAVKCNVELPSKTNSFCFSV